MSIDRCVECGIMIDTDYDCDAYFLIYDEDENKQSGEINHYAARCEDHRYFTTKEEALKHEVRL